MVGSCRIRPGSACGTLFANGNFSKTHIAQVARARAGQSSSDREKQRLRASFLNSP